MKKLTWILLLAFVSVNAHAYLTPTTSGGGGSVTSVSGTAPVSVSGGTAAAVVSMAKSTSSVDGYLAGVDFTTFNAKQAAISGNSCSANQFSNSINSSGTISCAQPAFTNISGTATPAQTSPASVAMAALNIDWSAGNLFSKTLAANSTFTFTNNADGHTVVVAVTNTGSNYTLAWTPTISWTGGVTPTQTVGAHTDVYTFVQIGSTVYGAVVQNY